MTDGDAPPTDLSLTDEWNDVVEERTVRERVYEVATTLTDPTAVSTVAERADCGKEGARTHLEWFVELGVLDKVADNPALFVRNEPYFEFRRVTALVRRYGSVEAIDREIETYRERAAAFSEEFGEPTPDAVTVDDVDDGTFEATLDRLGEWRVVERRLRELKEARLHVDRESGPTVASH